MRQFLRSFSEGWGHDDDAYSSSQSRTFPATLASALPGANFLVEATVHWRGEEPADVAKVRAFVWDQLARRAAGHRVTAASHLADLVNARGVTEFPVPGTTLTIIYLHVAVTVPAEALAATTAWEEAKRREILEEQRRDGELRQLQWLRDEIFGKPDLARMYWHLRHPSDLRVLGDPVFDTVATQLRSEGPMAAPPRVEEDSVGALIGGFLAGLDADERGHLIGQLPRVFRNFDRPDLADRLTQPDDRAER